METYDSVSKAIYDLIKDRLADRSMDIFDERFYPLTPCPGSSVGRPSSQHARWRVQSLVRAHTRINQYMHKKKNFHSTILRRIPDASTLRCLSCFLCYATNS
ncbi:uncharacterized protein [Saccopteryx bilineata]|uniref:uncharacterized protein isoform X2 n=1 Tax=Saccopteryx bilineata TaxID=59482 RepID=UPI00338E674F